MIRPALKG